MASMLEAVLGFYHKATVDWADPRGKNYPLLGHPENIIALVGVYLLFCLKIGPKFMENRKPYDIKKYIIIYNIIQILINVFLLVKSFPYVSNLNWRCAPVEYEQANMPYFVYGYYYFLLKLLDLLDTVFFVLKKNQRQITLLHVYHHTMMVLMTWFGTTYFNGGHSYYFAYFNLIVHTVMYSYYLLCALNEKQRQNVWWKKYITQIQIAQFGANFLTYLHLLFRTCNYPKPMAFLIVFQNGIVTCLFLDFYYKTYIRKKQL